MTRAIREAWDNQANRFDEQPDHGLSDARVRTAWAALLQDALPVPPARVLDVGCGTGSVAVLMAALGFVVQGIDLSPRMLEQAAAKARRLGVEVALLEGDARDPQVGGPFDVVLSRHVLWALPDVPAVLHRWASLLVPGGRLVLVEGRWHTGAGLPAEDLLPLVRSATSAVELHHLPDPALWGGHIEDERYLIVATA
ncbi:methyltransferase family protein [Pseudonocardia hierapolitana]|uniref:Methyltransferase family protein n=1 Tax=Pseudonocardia hierapolitana TaxID=1128676 RepID=A0A561ST18_9PSEU|nr:class I SAM-dependent methyltransferase [Pseudonocardia hierapolitana]TWF78001.1 methyltransferase family protein [Pseudonocardia hierapolitana]